jgi:hypothetical protein
MRTGDPRRLVLNKDKSRLSDAYILGLGSIATQTVFIKLILSSQVGGELYAAIAIGGWIASSATGALFGGRIKSDLRSHIWLISAILKIPLAFFIFVYPAFFTGNLDPGRFLPLVILGIAPTGILYGMLFPLLITKISKTSLIYRNEAVGSVIGGISMLVLSYLGVGGFTALFLISGIELSRALYGKILTVLIPLACVVIGVFAGPRLDKMGLDIRWPGFKTIEAAHGFSGLWALHERENQLTITHNGEHLQTIPNRPVSEEALLWPLLYYPQAKKILLIGFEGIETQRYLPENVRATKLISDRAFFKLGIREDVEYIVADPLSYRPNHTYDIVNLFFHGGGNLGDYRIETDYFFDKCKGWVKEGGLFYISAISDENYISPELEKYISAIKNTLDTCFEHISLIPGPRIGFICGSVQTDQNPERALRKLDIDSPYFNESLIVNRLAPFRIARLQDQISEGKIANDILKPSSVVNYLQWVGSMFGHSGNVFRIYQSPVPLFFFPAMILIPFAIALVKKTEFLSHLSITLLGALGMASELAALYLFQILFGSLYLHIGLIIAAFMAGMAVGAHYGGRLKTLTIVGPVLICLIILNFLSNLIVSGIGLTAAFVLLYLLAVTSGFCSGGGFTALAERGSGDRMSGATLYGADLYGAMIAAIFVPGIMLAFGITFLIGSLMAITLVILATLLYLKR